MQDLGTWGWLVVCLVAFLVGVSKTGVPGIGILSVVMLAFAVDTGSSLGLMLLMLVVGDVIAVAWYRRHAVWSHLFKLLPPAMVGLVIGYKLMGVVTDEQLRPILGGIVLALLAINRWWQGSQGSQNSKGSKGSEGSQGSSAAQSRVPTRWWFAGLVGAAAGVTTMMSNAAGPIILIYFLAMRLDKHEFIGTGAWYFFILNSLKIPFMAHLELITAESLHVNLLMLPVILAGAIAGILVFKRIPQKAFAAIVELLTLLAALRLVVPPGAWDHLRRLAM